jgi:hypothetical protein
MSQTLRYAHIQNTEPVICINQSYCWVMPGIMPGRCAALIPAMVYWYSTLGIFDHELQIKLSCNGSFRYG